MNIDSTSVIDSPNPDLRIAEITNELSEFLASNRGSIHVREVNHPRQVPSTTSVISPSFPTINEITPAGLAGFIDHTLLKPDATEEQIRHLCDEALEYGFATVCVNSTWVLLCATLLKGSPVKVCTVAGFPLGASLPEVKMEEAIHTAQLGATEVDMVLNVGRLKSQHYSVVYDDMASVVKAVGPGGVAVKVILETALLTDEEKIRACVLAKYAGVDFVKTATGFNGGGATVADIALMRKTVGPQMGVKASGGVRTSEDALNMIRAGATRIGASAGVAIVQDYARQLDGQPDNVNNIASASSQIASEAY